MVFVLMAIYLFEFVTGRDTTKLRKERSMAIYVRKTRDYFAVEQYTGKDYGWEEVCAEDSRSEARARVKEYRINQPEYPVRWRLRREKINDKEPTAC